MKRWLWFALVGLLTCSMGGGKATGRGFGGFRGGGFEGSRSESFGGSRFESSGRSGFDSFEGSRSSSFGGSRSGNYGGWDRGGSYSGSHSAGGYSGWNRGAGTSSYDRSWSGSRGGSVDVSGERGYAYGPRGAAAGGSRDVTATGAEGRTYSSSAERGAAVGPYGRYVGGGEHSATATGPRGTASGSWQSAFAGSRFPTDFGAAHYSSFNAAGVGHSTAYWSAGAMTTHAGNVRTNFGYYNCFHAAWYTAHPGSWYAAGWAAGSAWTAASWPAVTSWCGIPAAPIDYDYGSTVVYQNNDVYVNGQNAGTAQDYATQAITLADQGQKANVPPEEEWKPLGVFALVPGAENSSNNIFQLALNKAGIIRGNYYDGLMDTTSPVYGSVDKKTQRAAWTIGKKNDRVFEAGVSNLTKPEAPVLVHFGTDKTQQWLLVRVEQPATAK
jgi:hypothetical protein